MLKLWSDLAPGCGLHLRAGEERYWGWGAFYHVDYLSSLAERASVCDPRGVRLAPVFVASFHRLVSG